MCRDRAIACFRRVDGREKVAKVNPRRLDIAGLVRFHIIAVANPGKNLPRKSSFDVFAAIRGRRRRASEAGRQRAKTALSYPIELSRHEEGGYRVYSPHFPELETFGINEEDAVMHARYALEEAIAARVAKRQVVPMPLRAEPEHVQIPLSDDLAKLLDRYWRFNLGQHARRPAD